jgi:hypothetical protein
MHVALVLELPVLRVERDCISDPVISTTVQSLYLHRAVRHAPHIRCELIVYAYLPPSVVRDLFGVVERLWGWGYVHHEVAGTEHLSL